MPERYVLFVCVENSCRSLMAEAIFNADPPAGWTAKSAGTTRPRPRIPGPARCWQRLGLPCPHTPRGFSRRN